MTVTATTERELKLLCDEDFDRDALVAMLAEAGLKEQPPVVNQDTYMDTRSRSLARAGLAGRYRLKGGKRKVQVKPEPLLPELLFERTELGAPLGKASDAGKAIRSLIEQALPLKIRGEPRAELVLRNQRERFEVGGQDGCAFTAELCLDRVGVMRPNSRRSLASFVELELEYGEGDLHAFEALAERIATLPGVRPSNMSKHRRGMELLGLQRHRFAIAVPQFGLLATADEVARVTCQALYKTIRSYEPGTRAGLDPEQLHKMRVATRRLRATLQNFEGCFDRRTLGFLQRNLRWLAGVLGQVRDLDVHQMDVATWQRELGPEPAAGWETLRASLAARWKVRRAELIAALDSPRYLRLCERASEVFAKPAPRRRAGHAGAQPVVELASARISKRVRQFRKAARGARRRPSTDATHALRIIGKKLRYTCEVFAPLYGKAFRKRVGRLSKFQDVLGRFNDAVVAGDLSLALRDEALATDSEANGPYLYVLGCLSTWAATSAARAKSQVAGAYRDLDGKALLRYLANTAARAVDDARGLTEAEQAADAAVALARSAREVSTRIHLRDRK